MTTSIGSTRTLSDRLETALPRCGSVKAVAAAVFAAIAADVPHVFACLATTDPLTGVITWAYKSHPLEIGDREFAAAEYGEPDINQFSEIARRAVPVGVLSIDTGGHPEHCRRFREYMIPVFGFTDEIRVLLSIRGLTWGVLALYRGPGDQPFSAAEGARVAAVHPIIADAIRRTLFAGDQVAHEPVPEPAVIIVDSDGRPLQLTRAARDRIDDLGGWDNGALPASVLAVAVNARSAAGVFVSRLRLVSGPWVTVRGSVLEGDDDTTRVVVTIDLAHPADLTGLTLIGLGLTAREQEIVSLVVKGASTKAIASALHLSPHTVQDHLKAVFAKLGINSRRQLIAQLVS